MESKNFGLRVAGTIFGVIALLHLLRLLTGTPILILGWLLPVWVNLFGCNATSLLSFWLWKLTGLK